MSRVSESEKIQPQWLSKTILGALLCLTLAYGIVAIFAWYGPGGIDADLKGQFNMWMISPFWLTFLSFSYMFRTTLRMVVALSAANILVYGVYFVLGWAL